MSYERILRPFRHGVPMDIGTEKAETSERLVPAKGRGSTMRSIGTGAARMSG